MYKILLITICPQWGPNFLSGKGRRISAPSPKIANQNRSFKEKQDVKRRILKSTNVINKNCVFSI